MSGILTGLARRLNGGRAAAAIALAALVSGCAAGGGGGESGAAAPSAEAAAAARAARVDAARPAPVALLAPLSAPEPAAAETARGLVQGARLAAAEAGPALISLQVIDTRGTPEGAAAAAREALDGGAALLLGPLYGANVPAAAGPAAARGVNLLAFSNTPSVAGGEAGNVWLVGALIGDQTRRILTHAAAEGVRTVGLWHPLDGQGEVAREAAQASAAALGLRLAPVSGYRRDFDGVQDAARAYAEAHRAAGAEAVLLPDSSDAGLTLQSAAAFLALHDVYRSNTRLLGLAGWDDPYTLRENAMIGGRFAATDPSLRDAFAARMRAATGAGPGPFAALGYDAVSAAAEMARRARAAGDATPFDADAVTRPEGFPGAQGRLRFTTDGLNRREWAVLQVERRGFATVEPAPSAPRPAAPVAAAPGAEDGPTPTPTAAAAAPAGGPAT